MSKVTTDYRRIQMVLDSLPNQADRDALADTIEYVSALADPKANPNGHVPEGNLTKVYEQLARTNPAAAAAMDGLAEYVRTPRFAPFTDKLNETERLHTVGMGPRMQTIVDAADGLAVIHGLQQKMGNDSTLPRKPPTLRDHIARAATLEEPKARMAAHADREVAKAGAETNLPLRKHLEISSDIIGSNRGHDHDEGLLEPRGNNDLRADVERAVLVSVADSMPS